MRFVDSFPLTKRNHMDCGQHFHRRICNRSKQYLHQLYLLLFHQMIRLTTFFSLIRNFHMLQLNLSHRLCFHILTSLHYTEFLLIRDLVFRFKIFWLQRESFSYMLHILGSDLKEHCQCVTQGLRDQVLDLQRNNCALICVIIVSSWILGQCLSLLAFGSHQPFLEWSYFCSYSAAIQCIDLQQNLEY